MEEGELQNASRTVAQFELLGVGVGEKSSSACWGEWPIALDGPDGKPKLTKPPTECRLMDSVRKNPDQDVENIMKHFTNGMQELNDRSGAT